MSVPDRRAKLDRADPLCGSILVHVSEHMSDSKDFEVITAAAERVSVSPGRSYRT